VSKTNINNYDDECHKFNTNILTHGNNDWFMTVNTNNLLKVCHQNIRGLLDKTEEFLSSLLFDPPHIICLEEHHLIDPDIDNVLIDNYVLGAKYCRKIHKNGGVCIFIHDSIKFSNTSIVKNCVEMDIEACAIKLISTNIKIIVLAVYRSPSGNFDKFLVKLDNILNTLQNNKSEFIICGDMNINYLENCDRRQQLDTLLSTYNLIGTANFPT
jgi:exonuclease III